MKVHCGFHAYDWIKRVVNAILCVCFILVFLIETFFFIYICGTKLNLLCVGGAYFYKVVVVYLMCRRTEYH